MKLPQLGFIIRIYWVYPYWERFVTRKWLVNGMCFFFNVLPHMFPVNDGGEMTDSQDKRGLKHAELQDKSSPLGNNDDDAT